VASYIACGHPTAKISKLLTFVWRANQYHSDELRVEVDSDALLQLCQLPSPPVGEPLRAPHEPMPQRNSRHPAFAFLAWTSLIMTALPSLLIFSGSDGVNPFGVLWLLWGGFWTVLWWLFARGRR
jgi:hypothetical protein